MSLRLRYQFTRQTHGDHAVLRVPDERLRRCRNQRQQPGTGELGTAEPQLLERHRRPGRRAAAIHAQPDERGGRRRVHQPRPPQLHHRRRHPPPPHRHPLPTGSTRRLRLHGSAHRVRLRRLPARAFRATSQIAYGNADKYLRGFSYDAYVTDDWRVGPSLTITAGARWEYESPLSERFDRLVNLDIASGLQRDQSGRGDGPDRVADGSVVSLVADAAGLGRAAAAPGRGVAAGARIVGRGACGIRNLPQHERLSVDRDADGAAAAAVTALSIANTPANPLTLANGFVAPAGETLNTFAVDPDFRIGSAHNWQVSIQRDLPASLTVNATYLGTKGTGLIQEFLPNTYPPGFVNPCPTCPSGFVYLHLERHARRGMRVNCRFGAGCATASPPPRSTRSPKPWTMQRRMRARI